MTIVTILMRRLFGAQQTSEVNYVSKLEEALGKRVGTGEFGADMKVSLINDGPVTICMDTNNKE